MPANLYEILGLSSAATPQQIRAAYISIAKIAHPDNDGDVEHFVLIKRAYDTLSDPAQRALYDESGYIDGDKGSEIRRAAFHNLERLFSDILGQIPIEALPRVDIVQTIREIILKCRTKYDREIIDLENESRTVAGARSIIKKQLRYKKNAQTNIFIKVLDQKDAQIKQKIMPLQDKIAIAEESLSILREYEFDTEIILDMQHWSGQSTTTTGFMS